MACSVGRILGVMHGAGLQHVVLRPAVSVTVVSQMMTGNIVVGVLEQAFFLLPES